MTVALFEYLIKYKQMTEVKLSCQWYIAIFNII